MLSDDRSLLGLETQSIAIRFSISDASPAVQTPDISWAFLPDEASGDSDFTDITEQAQIGETVLTFSESRLELTLSGLTQDAEGTYRLVATNPAGMDSDYTNLTIQGIVNFCYKNLETSFYFFWLFICFYSCSEIHCDL